jgi:hypothetical protein
MQFHSITISIIIIFVVANILNILSDEMRCMKERNLHTHKSSNYFCLHIIFQGKILKYRNVQVDRFKEKGISIGFKKKLILKSNVLPPYFISYSGRGRADCSDEAKSPN